MDDKVFKLVNRYSNDDFSKMDRLTLREILSALDDYYLELRTKLSIPEITFGIEIELEHTHTRKIKHKIFNNNLDNWKVTGDASLDDGCEIVSPILTNTYDCYKEIKKVCEIAEKNGEIDKHSAGHIHVGTQTLGGDNKDNWINLAGLWSVYENIFYRFLYGEYLTPRDSIEKYAGPIAPHLFSNYISMKDRNDKFITAKRVVCFIRVSRDSAINFSHVYEDLNYNPKTSNIEFRCPNGTVDPVIWQNNINLIGHILNYASSDDFDRDLICNRGNDIGKFNLQEYNRINLEKALEVCDLIFNNNIDKLYFLRQYLKSNQTSNRPLVKAKKFTK